MTDDDRNITGGGGIVRGSSRSASGDATETAPELMRAFRRRWATGVAVMTLRDEDRMRGVTVTAMMPLSVEPPLLAVGLTGGSAFAGLAEVGSRCAVSILVRPQEFLSERFAGRAPVPDATFGGIPHDLDEHGVPVLADATAVISGVITACEPHGDHVLVVIGVDGGTIAEDEDDPLLSYEGSYRDLEVE